MNFNINFAQLNKLIIPLLTGVLVGALLWVGWQLYTTVYSPLFTQSIEVAEPTEFTIPTAKIDNARKSLSEHTKATTLETFDNPFAIEAE